MTTPEEMRVVTGHLREMATKHQQVVTDVGAANHATSGALSLVTATHGPVCAPTITALTAATLSREKATTIMQGISDMLAGGLQEGAAKYDTTDHTESGNLDGQMHPQ